MATNGNNDLHILIVGAGTSGLLIAQGLKKVYDSVAKPSNAQIANTII
jgi:cation diffusion facilitator CzcD-associated flavoprotein CzcO